MPAAEPSLDPTGRGTAAVIPARDEAATVGAVVFAARDARLVDQVVVVDNGSRDATARNAAAHGARVIHAPAPGKGQAMRAGVAATPDAAIIVFLDADLVGLRPDHVDSLVRPVLHGEATMTCGLFDRGPVQNPLFLRGLPVLSGQRALHRTWFEQLTEDDVRGYRVEAALNSLVARHGGTRLDQVLPGLWHRTKEEKLASPLLGRVTKVAMLSTAAWSYLRMTSAGRPTLLRRHPSSVRA